MRHIVLFLYAFSFGEGNVLVGLVIVASFSDTGYEGVGACTDGGCGRVDEWQHHVEREDGELFYLEGGGMWRGRWRRWREVTTRWLVVGAVLGMGFVLVNRQVFYQYSLEDG